MTGNRKHSGRNKTLYVTYRCGGSALKAKLDCDNKEINKEKLEQFVLKELGKVIFNDDTLNSIIENYEEFCRRSNNNEIEKADIIKRKLQAVQGKIDNLVEVMATTGSKNVLSTLSRFEEEQSQLEKELHKCEDNSNFPKISKEQIRKVYETARDLFISGQLRDKQLLINHYLNKVVVFKEHIEIYLGLLPTYLYFYDPRLLGRKRCNKNTHKRTLAGSIVSKDGGACATNVEHVSLFVAPLSK